MPKRGLRATSPARASVSRRHPTSETPADLAIVPITGPEHPKPLPSAYFVAATTAAAEQNVVMSFTGPATELLAEGKAETIFPMEGGKSVAEVLKPATDNEARTIGCLQSLELNGMPRDDVPADIQLTPPSTALPSLAAAGKVLTW